MCAVFFHKELPLPYLLRSLLLGLLCLYLKFLFLVLFFDLLPIPFEANLCVLQAMLAIEWFDLCISHNFAKCICQTHYILPIL